MSEIVVSQLNIYPVKSLKGITLNSANVEPGGFQFDRRWMLVEPSGQFITQRQYPALALVSVSVSGNSLVISTEEKMPILVPFEIGTKEKMTVQIWKNSCNAIHVDKKVDEWFSSFLNFECKLVYMPYETFRPVNPEYDTGNNKVSFADGFPFLIISESSLRDLNSRLESPVPMNRFRPNIVVSGSEPYAEDTWKEIIIGNITFYLVKPCERCVVTTIDQNTGKSLNDEPLRTLATYRRINKIRDFCSEEKKVIFGQNMIAKGTGVINTGDILKIVL